MTNFFNSQNSRMDEVETKTTLNTESIAYLNRGSTVRDNKVACSLDMFEYFVAANMQDSIQKTAAYEYLNHVGYDYTKSVLRSQMALHSNSIPQTPLDNNMQQEQNYLNNSSNSIDSYNLQSVSQYTIPNNNTLYEPDQLNKNNAQ